MTETNQQKIARRLRPAVSGNLVEELADVLAPPAVVLGQGSYVKCWPAPATDPLHDLRAAKRRISARLAQACDELRDVNQKIAYMEGRLP